VHGVQKGAHKKREKVEIKSQQREGVSEKEGNKGNPAILKPEIGIGKETRLLLPEPEGVLKKKRYPGKLIR